jgi:hypothetical protein
MLWPLHDQDTDGLAGQRHALLRQTLQGTGFIKPLINDWTVIDELFGEDLDELLRTCWKQLVKTAIENGMLETLDDAVHNVGCNKICLNNAHTASFKDYKRWYIRRKRSVSTVLCF